MSGSDVLPQRLKNHPTSDCVGRSQPGLPRAATTELFIMSTAFVVAEGCLFYPFYSTPCIFHLYFQRKLFQEKCSLLAHIINLPAGKVCLSVREHVLVESLFNVF